MSITYRPDQPRLGRRGLLRGLLGVVVGLPFLEALAPPAAAQARAPRRMIFWTSPNGSVLPAWEPEVDGQDRITGLSPILQPLDRFRQQLLPVGGLTMGSALSPEAAEGGHAGGAAALLTNSYLGAPDATGLQRTGNASIDHALATHLLAPTRFDCVRLAVRASPPRAASILFRGPTGLPLLANPNPWDVHRQLFSDEFTDAAAHANLTATRRTVLDAVLQEYRALRCQLGPGDRIRLEQHLEAVHEVEARLGQQLASGACGPVDIGPDRDPVYLAHNDSFEQLGRLQMDLMALALSCDVSRVGAIQWGAAGDDLVFTWLGQHRSHHSLSHENTDAANAQLIDIYRWYSEQLAYFLDRLQAVVEEDGSRLLDNVCVCATSEISLGWNHGVQDMPMLLAGNLGGALTPGRYLRFAGENHGRLWVTLLNAMGIDTDTFGDPRFADGGALPGLTA